MIYIHLINNNIKKDKMTFNCKTIKKINLTLLSPNEIEKKAVVKIISSELFSKDNKPSPNGLFDNRMGPYNKYSKCKTCYNDFENCPGHFGYIELETPVIYLHFIKYIKKILNCVCHCCSYLMISDCKDLLKILLTKKKDKRLNFILSYMEKNKNKLAYGLILIGALMILGIIFLPVLFLPTIGSGLETDFSSIYTSVWVLAIITIPLGLVILIYWNRKCK